MVNWEFAGRMPVYWECANACSVNEMSRFDKEHVDRFLEPIPVALEMEALRKKCSGDC